VTVVSTSTFVLDHLPALQLEAIGTVTGGPDVVIEHVEAGDGDGRDAHVQVFRGGRLEEWRVGRDHLADISFEYQPGAMTPILTGRLVGTDAMSEVTVATLGDAHRRGLPPLDIPDRFEIVDVRLANLVVHYTIANSPVGTVEYHDVFRGGSLVARPMGPPPSPAPVSLNTDFFTFMLHRAGLIDFVEVVRASSFGGDVAYGGLAMALVDSEPMQHHIRLRAEASMLLASAAFHLRSDAYLDAIRRVVDR
jgi:hypothetical protein